MGELVTYLVDNRVAEITINHPPVNALNAQVIKELGEVVAEVAKEDVGAVIITGAGDKAFVAGADITQFLDLDAGGGQTLSVTGQRVFDSIAALPVPVIAAVNGFALGGGCELALACDIRIAAENANLGQPEVNLGIIPGYGGTQRLARLVGVGKAKELIFSGDTIPAQEALKIGLVEQVVGRGETLEAARKLAQKVLAKGPIAIRRAKQAIDESLEGSLRSGLDLEARLFGELFDTADQKEGARAFLEKRRAEFKGN